MARENFRYSSQFHRRFVLQPILCMFRGTVNSVIHWLVLFASGGGPALIDNTETDGHETHIKGRIALTLHGSESKEQSWLLRACHRLPVGGAKWMSGPVTAD
jgi:hypothetical protein